MSKINFKKDRIPFTQVANELLNYKNLSFKAKGLYAYLYSKPDGWDFSIDRIAKDTSEGRRSINSGLQELEREGFLIRERQSTGRVAYLLKSQMLKMDMGNEKPNVQNSKVLKQQSAKTDTVSNKDNKAIKSNSNKDTGEAVTSHGSKVSKKEKYSVLGADILKLFENVNPACRKMYNNKTQRKACDNLIELYGFETVEKVIAILPKTNTMSYVPTITTPLQLEQKWVSLESALKKKKETLQDKKVKVAFV